MRFFLSFIIIFYFSPLYAEEVPAGYVAKWDVAPLSEDDYNTIDNKKCRTFSSVLTEAKTEWPHTSAFKIINDTLILFIEGYNKQENHYLMSIYIEKNSYMTKDIYITGVSSIDLSTGKNYLHYVIDKLDDTNSLLYIDLHLVHEVTSPQAFESLRLSKRNVRQPKKTFAVPDHNVPTINREKIEDELSKKQLEALEKNTKDFVVHRNDQSICTLLAYKLKLPNKYYLTL